MGSIHSYPEGSLARALDHLPVVLGFGTSGRRGLLKDLTQLEIYINALAEIEYLKTLPPRMAGSLSPSPFTLLRISDRVRRVLMQQDEVSWPKPFSRQFRMQGLNPFTSGKFQHRP